MESEAGNTRGLGQRVKQERVVAGRGSGVEAAQSPVPAQLPGSRVPGALGGPAGGCLDLALSLPALD